MAESEQTGTETEQTGTGTETEQTGTETEQGGAGGAGGEGEGSSGSIDWKSQARRHERAAKTERKQREELAAKLKEREQADQTDHERAVAAAREEGEKNARAAADKERRSDRLESAAIRLASRGVKIGTGEDAQTARFADPDDAFVHLERAIRRGDIDEDDIFDSDGRVQNDALTGALGELLSDKPHLVAGDGGETRRVQGGADGGRGSGGGKGIEDMTTSEHLERIRQKR